VNTNITNECVIRNQIKKNQGGNIMKKMKNNKKGFSLIELLIVVAILAILAAISINLFGGVLNKSKDKADKAACSYLQTAIQTYIAESDDSTITALGGTVWATVIDRLANGVKDAGGKILYGPYLNSGTPKLSSNDLYFNVTVNSLTQTVTVTTTNTTPATGAAGTITIVTT
jgi:type IV pilus assembly protein PilA